MAEKYAIARPGKLNLKRPVGSSSSSSSSSSTVAAPRKRVKKDESGTAKADEKPKSAWVVVETVRDFAGPLFILLDSEARFCLAANEDGKLVASKVIRGAEEEDQHQQQHHEPITLATACPQQVSQVFSGVPVVGSPGQFGFKTSENKYLASDKFGAVSCSREAIGVAESWTVIIKPDGVSLQNAFTGKLLKVEQGSFSLRADSEECGFRETLHIKCQASRRPKVTEEVDTRDAAEIELDEQKKFQSWGLGRLKRRPDEDVNELRRAKEEGKIREALLDRRAKVKSDKFCK